MARGWKRAAEFLLARSGVPDLGRRRNAPSTIILAYHNIVPSGESLAGDLSLHVDQDVLADQLDFMLESHDVIPLSKARAPTTTSSQRARVVITFDDAYQGTMTAGLDELSRRGLPATVFVPPGLLGSSGFWWDILAPKEGGALAQKIREYGLGPLKGHGESILAWAAAEGLRSQELPPHARPATERTLVERASSEGLSLGAHTWSHPNLAALTPREIDEELTRSKAWLRSNAHIYVDWLAYPYGLENQAVVDAASRSFEGALLIQGGLAERRGQWYPNPYRTPRLNVPRALTLEGLALRLAGFLA